jgi:hypothetical protein
MPNACCLFSLAIQLKAQTFKKRRNYDELPKYGTVDDAIFIKGEDGLVPDPPIIEDNDSTTVAKEQDPFKMEESVKKKDWEKVLDGQMPKKGKKYIQK